MTKALNKVVSYLVELFDNRKDNFSRYKPDSLTKQEICRPDPQDREYMICNTLERRLENRDGEVILLTISSITCSRMLLSTTREVNAFHSILEE